MSNSQMVSLFLIDSIFGIQQLCQILNAICVAGYLDIQLTNSEKFLQ